jgi:hypothetical protein
MGLRLRQGRLGRAVEFRAQKLAVILKPRREALRSEVCANLARRETVAAV